jgi:hypothetical protein
MDKSPLYGYTTFYLCAHQLTVRSDVSTFGPVTNATVSVCVQLTAWACTALLSGRYIGSVTAGSCGNFMFDLS